MTGERDEAFRPWLARWGLRADGSGFTTAIGNHLLPVLWRGAPAMLKICADEEERRGGVLMAWYGGDGAAKVFEREAEAILLERVTGERSLARLSSEGEDDVATSILCNDRDQPACAASRAAPEGLVPLESWFDIFAPRGEGSGRRFRGRRSGRARLCSVHRARASPFTATFTTPTSSTAANADGWRSTPRA